jgi:hypothetical protein
MALQGQEGAFSALLSNLKKKRRERKETEERMREKMGMREKHREVKEKGAEAVEVGDKSSKLRRNSGTDTVSAVAPSIAERRGSKDRNSTKEVLVVSTGTPGKRDRKSVQLTRSVDIAPRSASTVSSSSTSPTSTNSSSSSSSSPSSGDNSDSSADSDDDSDSSPLNVTVTTAASDIGMDTQNTSYNSADQNTEGSNFSVPISAAPIGGTEGGKSKRRDSLRQSQNEEIERVREEERERDTEREREKEASRELQAKLSALSRELEVERARSREARTEVSTAVSAVFMQNIDTHTCNESPLHH